LVLVSTAAVPTKNKGVMVHRATRGKGELKPRRKICLAIGGLPMVCGSSHRFGFLAGTESLLNGKRDCAHRYKHGALPLNATLKIRYRLSATLLKSQFWALFKNGFTRQGVAEVCDGEGPFWPVRWFSLFSGPALRNTVVPFFAAGTGLGFSLNFSLPGLLASSRGSGRGTIRPNGFPDFSLETWAFFGTISDHEQPIFPSTGSAGGNVHSSSGRLCGLHGGATQQGRAQCPELDRGRRRARHLRGRKTRDAFHRD